MRDGMQIQLYEAKTTWRSSAKAAIKTTSAGLVGGRSSIDDRVRVDVHAVLAAEPDNLYGRQRDRRVGARTEGRLPAA
jgi:hypothetical protein